LLFVRLPSLKFLKTFQVAAARESFKAAADELFVTPSAVSHQIRALEQQLGVLLFERGPHSLTLTEAGRRYLQHMDSVFARLEIVTEQIRNRYARDVVRLRVPPFFATELLLPRLPSFLQGQADTDLHISTGAKLQQAHAADADVSIVVGARPDELHECRTLFSQRFVAACAPALLERMPIDTVADLQRHTLIVHEGRGDGWQRWAQTIGIELSPRTLVRVDTMHAAVHAAERGVGLALVSAPLSVERFARGSLVRVFDAELETGESYALIVRREDVARPDVGALTQWLVEQFLVS
jgi:LysR family glycine cleavage system transcriptional activator